MAGHAEKSLEQEDYGLDHAEVNQRIALHFMDTGRYDRAEPYARASAQSGAEWALDIAAECLEGLGKWDEAEEMTRDAALRYGHPLNWYAWCVETGHGHLVDASRLMEQYVAGASGLHDPEGSRILAVYLLGQGKTDQRIDWLRRHPADDWASLQAALWCAANKDEKGCDDMLNAARHGLRHFGQRGSLPVLMELAGIFQKCRADGVGAKLDLADIDELLGRARNPTRPLYCISRQSSSTFAGTTPTHGADYIRCLSIRGAGAASRMLAAMEVPQRRDRPDGSPIRRSEDRGAAIVMAAQRMPR